MFSTPFHNLSNDSFEFYNKFSYIKIKARYQFTLTILSTAIFGVVPLKYSHIRKTCPYIVIYPLKASSSKPDKHCLNNVLFWYSLQLLNNFSFACFRQQEYRSIAIFLLNETGYKMIKLAAFKHYCWQFDYIQRTKRMFQFAENYCPTCLRL